MAFRLGDWLVDPDRDLLQSGDLERKLDHKVMRLLLCLCEAPQQELSREEILHQVWTGVAVSPQVVTVAVSGLRKALGDDARRPAYIQTIPGHGYRLLVRAAPDSPRVRPSRAAAVGTRWREVWDWIRAHQTAALSISLATLILIRLLLFPLH